MSSPLIGYLVSTRETGWADGDARERPVLGTGGGAVQLRPGFVPVVLPGRRQSLLTGRRAAWLPCPVARVPRAGCCPAGGAGCLPPPQVRGGRIEVIVAWRRARRFGRLCRRHQPSPGDAGQCLAARACRRPASAAGARTVSRLMPATGSGRGAIPGPAPDDRPAPPPGPPGVGMIPAQPSPAPSPPWPGSDGAARASPQLPAWPGGTGAGGLPVPPAGSR
jgi:hypothetical protein